MAIIFIVFIFGLLFGSFANVCIYRMPREMSIVFPPSHCTKCNNPILWYDNIPILSYLILKGKCRKCGDKISIRYPLVEAACGLLFVLMFFVTGLTYMLPVFCFFAFCMLVITMIDFDFQIIPDEFSIGLIIVGLLTSFLNSFLGTSSLERFLQSILGCVAGGGSLIALAIIGKFMFKQDAMGGGDIKLMAGVGAFIGWQRVLFAIFIAAFIGSVVGITLIVAKKMKKRDMMPFGPCLAVASLLTLFLAHPAYIVNKIIMYEENLFVKLFF